MIFYQCSNVLKMKWDSLPDSLSQKKAQQIVGLLLKNQYCKSLTSNDLEGFFPSIR